MFKIKTATSLTVFFDHSISAFTPCTFFVPLHLATKTIACSRLLLYILDMYSPLVSCIFKLTICSGSPFRQVHVEPWITRVQVVKLWLKDFSTSGPSLLKLYIYIYIYTSLNHKVISLFINFARSCINHFYKELEKRKC